MRNNRQRPFRSSSSAALDEALSVVATSRVHAKRARDLAERCRLGIANDRQLLAKLVEELK
jgi:hypothetical protein